MYLSILAVVLLLAANAFFVAAEFALVKVRAIRLEAMASALPVVGARVGGIPEMIVEGDTGLLVPARDPQALADAIESVVRDPVRARAMGDAGRRRARILF